MGAVVTEGERERERESQRFTLGHEMYVLLCYFLGFHRNSEGNKDVCVV